LDIQKEINLIEGMIAKHGDTKGKDLQTQLEVLYEQRTEYNNLLKSIENEKTELTELVLLNQQIAADKSLQDQTEEYTSQIIELTTREEELLELERQRKIDAIELSDEYKAGTPERKQALVDEVNWYYAVRRTVEANKEIGEVTEEYGEKIKEITREQAKLAIMNNNSLSDKEKQIALVNYEADAIIEEIAASDEWAQADKAKKDEMIATVRTWEYESTKAIKDVNEEGKDLGSFMLENWQDFYNAGASILTDLMTMSNTILQKSLDEQSKELDKWHEDEMKRIDDEMHARLYALGLVEAETVEDYEAQLEAAKESGDELAIYEATQALTKAQIEQEYADEKARIDEAEEKTGRIAVPV
jgi:hypothetical protein